MNWIKGNNPITIIQEKNCSKTANIILATLIQMETNIIQI